MDWSTIVKTLETNGMKLLAGILVLVIGFFLAHWLLKLVTRSERFIKIEPTLKGFLGNLFKLLLYVIIILTAAGIMGIPLTSFLTILASAGVAISLAMQGALSNFVGGMTILMLKPFKVGHYIKTGDTEGTVKKIGVFYTELTTPDNRHILLPNSNLTGSPIINYTVEGTRRVDVSFSLGYGADMDAVYETLRKVIERTDKILPDPAPIIKLTECADSAVVYMIRVWCASADYWEVNWALTENGKRALDAAGLEIPYPQLDVHMR